MELFLLLLAAGILFKLIRAFFRLLGSSGTSKKRRIKEDEKLPPPDSPAKWYGAVEEPSFKGFSIPGGLVYVGGKLLDYSGTNDACLINPHLELSDEEAVEPFVIHGLSYSAISPRQRVAYLEWLSDGRENPDCDSGCVLLFFYGLERRLFLDGPRGRVLSNERKSIVLEVLRLLQIYGKNELLRGFFLNLLAMEWALFGEGKEIPAYLNFPGACGTEVFPAIAACLADRDLPLPGETALQWLIPKLEENILPAARRHPELFRQLFLLRYNEKFERGIPLYPGRSPLILEYCGANPSLGSRLKIRIPNLPNPFVIRVPLQKITALAAECAVELEPYSLKLLELKGKEDTSARKLLPHGLIPFLPEKEGIHQELSNLCASGPVLVRLRLLERILGYQTPAEIIDGVSSLKEKAEAFGFAILPSCPGEVLSFCCDPLIALYEGPAVTAPSEECCLLAAIIRLGAIIFQASGRVLTAGENLLRALIGDDERLSEDEKKSLQALLLWTFRTPQSASELRGVLRDFSEEWKGAMSRMLLTVGLADGTMDKEEVKQLEKLYSYFGLEKKKLSSDLASLSSVAEPSDERSSAELSYKSLYQELTLLQQRETGRIDKIFDGIFENPCIAEEKSDSSAETSLSPTSLDEAHRKLLERLAEKSTWNREEYSHLCSELSLSVESSLARLNKWIFAKAGMSLIEDGDPIFIDTLLVKEVLRNGKPSFPERGS